MRLKVNAVSGIFSLLDGFNSTMLFNVGLIVAAFLIIIYVRRIDVENEVDKQSQANKKIYDNLFDVLIESNPQPTLIVDDSIKIYLLNSSAQEILHLGLESNLDASFSFIEHFMKQDNIHLQKEIEFENNNYLVSLSKFDSSVLSGAFINFANVTHIKAAQQRQNSFVQNASHELKTPISVIQGVAEIVLDNEDMPKEQLNKFMRLISKENERLNDIVSNLTVASEIKPNYTNFSIQNLLEEIKIMFDNYDQELNKVIKFRIINEIDGAIKQDEAKIMQILINLIGNSYKYTDEGSIDLRAFRAGEYLCFSVKDTGIGINNDEFSSIFDRFYRVEKSRARQTGGSGLGLNIVKELIEALAGSVEVFSDGDTGSEFRVYLKDRVDD